MRSIHPVEYPKTSGYLDINEADVYPNSRPLYISTRDSATVAQETQELSHTSSTSEHQPRTYESSPPQPRSTDSVASHLFRTVLYPHRQYFTLSKNTMSLAYENRGFADYPAGSIMEEPLHEAMHHQQHNQQYPSPSPIAENYTNAHIESALDIGGLPDLPQKEDEEAPSPGRSKALMKPDREVTKGEDGRFICSWNGCTEDVRSFNRKCEWSKHMDKHDRPYKCPADGCEKLPGFTYSGGLLRHEREVHNLHGGPRKQLNCPHINCKRHSGKGFSRQENLNEHLRRVHTTPGDGELPNPEETEDEGGHERSGMKRKRLDQGGRDDTNEMRDNYNRLAQENADLRRQVDLQGAQIAELMHQIQNFTQQVQQDVMNSRMPNQAPQAMM